MVTHPSRVLENISVSFLDANASLYWDNTFPVKPFTYDEYGVFLGPSGEKTRSIGLMKNSKFSDP